MTNPPIPPSRPVERSLFGETVVDEFAWMRDRDDPATIAHLTAENAYFESVLGSLEGLRDTIFDEIVGRTQLTDISAPTRRGDWWYASKTEEGRQYPIFVRMHCSPEAEEQVILDANELAEGHGYLSLGVFEVSPDHRLLAYSVDNDGSESFTLRFRDLETGIDLPDVVEDTYYSGAWNSESDTFFYTTFDAAHRPDRVWIHQLGRDDDRVVFEERDDRMFLSVKTTSDRRYVLVTAGSQITADVHYAPADDPGAEFRPVLPRVHGVQFSADHRDGRWLVVTDHDAPNGRLISVAVDDPSDVTTLIPHEPARKVSSVRAFRNHVVVSGRMNGLTSLTVITDDTATPLEFDEETYTVGLGANYEFDTSTIRISYQSLTTPRQIIDVDLETDSRTVVKEQPVLGDYSADDYVSERLWAVADDGTEIPISLVRHRDVDLPAPALLYGYGSYEVTVDPYFSIPRLSLLERGVVFAIAHIRGGGEMGRAWYEGGKLASKINTFTDFVRSAEHLVEIGVTAPDRLAIRGGSAGGLLVGAAMNLRPDLFRAAVAEVPFVDVINTMLDETLPLTVIEWEEWGNPQIEEQYGWMRAYSPYENVREGAEYPALFVTAGLNDPRVSYWEPAKWVASLRTRTTSRGPVVLKTEMGAGHGGKSGRYDAWRDEAEVIAFLLDQTAWLDRDSGNESVNT
ncbi:MAG: S9 family peptidase, partial [Acidimicrobiia bacterium]|nr:S9 family peptidase [Acidimicrobiia bacterium]